MDWATVKNGVQAWFATATGLTRTIWADQNAPRPAYPYGLLTVVSDDGVGPDEHRYTLLEDSPPAGADLQDVISGNRPFTIQCEVLTAPTDSSSLGHNATAQYYLGLARTKLSDITAMATLYAAGVGYLRREATIQLDAVVHGRFISRGAFDVHFMAAENLTATATTYINSTEVTGTIEGTVTEGSLDFTETFGG